MRHLRYLTPSLGIYFALFVACLAIGAASGCSSSARHDTIRATLVSVDAARDGFVTWDGSHQTDLVNKAKTREEAEASVTAYRDQRTKIVEGFRVAYRALAFAATANDDPSLRAALEEARKLLEEIQKLRGP